MSASKGGNHRTTLHYGSLAVLGASLAALFVLEAGRPQQRQAEVRRRPLATDLRRDAKALVVTDGSETRSAGGHDAQHPSEFPPKAIWQVVKRTSREALADRLMTEAAGVTFYTLLALAPALAALVSLYALFADPVTINDHLSALSGVVPGGGMDIITEQVKRMAANSDGKLGLSAVIGLGLSLWSANQASKAIFDALNVVYEEKEKRGFIRLTATSLAFTLGLILFAIVTMTMVVVLPVVLNMVWLGAVADAGLKYGRWPLMLLVVSVVLACLYRWGPSRASARWRWVSWGSIFASFGWLGISALFSLYVANFGNYNETYGSLGAVVGFMTWIWISAMVVLFGAELNAELEHQTAQDTTIGVARPMGERRATMADRVAGG